jgi:phage-related protein
MASIYNILEWDGNKTYDVHDIVAYGGNSYYAIKGSTEYPNKDKTPEIGSIWWDGVTSVTTRGDTKAWPYFFWDGSYGLSISHEPRISSVQFADGYEQRMADGLSSDLLSLDMSFESRSNAEATAIIHFLTSKQGYKGFYFKAPAPHNILKKFRCPNWSYTINFEDNYSINASFKEIS